MGERCISAEAVETSESHLLPFHLPFITKLIIIFLILFQGLIFLKNFILDLDEKGRTSYVKILFGQDV